MWTIGKLAREVGLSRSALLYYDSIGLLKPTTKERNGYRLYSKHDRQRLDQICLYRRVGLPLSLIKQVLEEPDNPASEILESRLKEMNQQIYDLRQQQHLIVGLLQNKELFNRVSVMSKDTWVDLLRESGFNEEDMHRWHMEFERNAPEKHQQFLEFLCIPEEEIRLIREWSRLLR